MTSGGGITTIDTAIRFPVRLIESGPAAGAIFAGCIARQHGLTQVLSFDMGGTTAKICLIDQARPQMARSMEVARIYRFLKGSGLPLRIPVIEMVEIGAGGGSIARIDLLQRITVGPDSAGSQPGPACYGQGGSEPTVTDADVVLGRFDPAEFSGGRIPLDAPAAEGAVAERIGGPLGLVKEHAALGISEMVDENMANAALVHAVESGKDLQARTLIAFGGAAPLHAAARVAEKLGIQRVPILRTPVVGLQPLGCCGRRWPTRSCAPAHAPFRLRRGSDQPIDRRDAGRSRSDRETRGRGGRLPSCALPSCAIAGRATK
jgi:N-methylhydantoinase A